MRCPYCRDEIKAGAQYACPACQTPHHRECWDQNGGCTVWGCAQAPGDGEKITIGAEGHAAGEAGLARSGSAPPPPPPPGARTGAQYHIDRSGNRMGPYSLEEARHFFAQGLLLPSDLAWTEGMTDWLPLTEVLSSGRRVPPLLPPAPSQVVAGPVGIAGVGPGNRPKTYMLEAILVTLFCCLPFGIPAIVFASQVDSKYNAGDYQGAQNASNSAKTWYHVSLIVGFIVIVIWIIAAAAGS